MAKAKPEPVRNAQDMLDTLAEGLETAAAAVRELIEEGVFNAEDAPDEPLEPATPPKKGVTVKKAGGKKKIVTFDELKEKMTDVMNAHGKEVVKGVMSEFGVQKLIEIDETSYADVMEKLNEAVAAAEAGAGGDDDDLFGQ